MRLIVWQQLAEVTMKRLVVGTELSLSLSSESGSLLLTPLGQDHVLAPRLLSSEPRVERLLSSDGGEILTPWYHTSPATVSSFARKCYGKMSTRCPLAPLMRQKWQHPHTAQNRRPTKLSAKLWQAWMLASCVKSAYTFSVGTGVQEFRAAYSAGADARVVLKGKGPT